MTRFKQKLFDDIPQLKCWNPYLKVSESKELSDSIKSSIIRDQFAAGSDLVKVNKSLSVNNKIGKERVPGFGLI